MRLPANPEHPHRVVLMVPKPEPRAIPLLGSTAVKPVFGSAFGSVNKIVLAGTFLLISS